MADYKYIIRKRWVLKPIFTLFSLFLFAGYILGQPVVYKFNIKEEIAPSIWHKTKKAFEEADSCGAQLFLIHMNTYGGTVLDADSIRTKILHSRIPVVVFIDNNAASAGALISIACDSIYMRPGGSIGAATVVDQTGSVVPEKHQSYMRTKMSATAEAKGKIPVVENGETIYKWRRNPLIAEAMVDPSVYIENLIDVGKILTFTPTEAVQNGYCEAIVENVDEILKRNGLENATIVEFKPSPMDKIIGFLLHPMVSGLLIMAIIGGIYFELQTPGIGFPLIIAILGAVLYFAPLYLEGLASNWEILVFIIGVILILLEIFVTPGFGVLGILGILMAFMGLTLSLIDNVHFNFENVSLKRVSVALMTVTVGVFGGIVLSLWLGRFMFSRDRGPLKKLSLKSVQDVKDGFISIDSSLLTLVGKTGISKTVLRPAGKVEIDNEVHDAVTLGEFIDKGKTVKVLKVEATQLYVEEEIAR